MQKVKRLVILLAAGSRVRAWSKNFIDRLRGDGRRGVIYIVAMFTGITQENNS